MQINQNEIPKEINDYKLFINEDYLKSAYKKEGFELCMIGQDPYPNYPNGIPFCKKDNYIWNSNNNNASSGFYLLKALGINFIKYKEYTEKESVQIFYNFLDKGVIFLNASHYYLKKESLTKKSHLQLLQKSHEINKVLIDKSKNVVFLGDATQKIINWLTIKPNSNKFYPIIHPVQQNKNKKPEVWSKFYSEPYGVNEFIKKINNDSKNK